MRTSLLFAAVATLLIVGAPAAQAQIDFSTFAVEDNLGGGPTVIFRAEGFDRLPSGHFAYFDDYAGDIYTYDPEANDVADFFGADDIEEDIGDFVPSIQSLITDSGGNIYIIASALNSSSRYIYKIDIDDDFGLILAQDDAADALALSPDESKLYIASTPRGVFDETSSTTFSSILSSIPAQTPTELYSNDSLDVLDIGTGSDGTIYATSSEFGDPPYDDVIVSLSDPEGDPSLSIVTDPLATGVFEGDINGLLESIEVFTHDGEDHFYATYAVPTSYGGVQFGFFDADGTSGQRFTTDEEIFADPDVTTDGGIAAPVGLYMHYDDQSHNLYLNTGYVVGEGEDQIVEISGQPLPVEFDGPPTATVSGADVTLSWRTLSEQRNAGFRVQHCRAGEQSKGWTSSPLLEGAGTTTEAHTYRHTVAEMAPGRHVFRVKQVDADGDAAFSPTVEAAVARRDFGLHPPAQNPLAGGRTTLAYHVSEGTAAVNAALYNSLGQRVRRLRAEGGRIVVEASGLASGLYFVRLVTADGRASVQPLTLVR